MAAAAAEAVPAAVRVEKNANDGKGVGEGDEGGNGNKTPPTLPVQTEATNEDALKSKRSPLRKVATPERRALAKEAELDPKIIYIDGEKHKLSEDFELPQVLIEEMATFFPCNTFHQLAGLCEMLDGQYSKAVNSKQHIFYNTCIVYSLVDSWKRTLAINIQDWDSSGKSEDT